MITVENLGLQYGGQVLFNQVDLQFTRGNCYGIIGANGAGKSTFLKILSGEVESTNGHIYIDPKARMSVLKQNQSMYDDYPVLETVIMGNMKLYECGKEKDAIYEKEDFTDEDGIRASELEGEFAELGGWESESDASKLVQGLGLSEDLLYVSMGDLTEAEKIKVLLARALFGQPEIILLDEPTVGLDPETEQGVLETIMEATAGKTLVMVAHHLQGIDAFDRVVFLEDGRLELDGSPAALAATSERYRTLLAFDGLAVPTPPRR